MLRLPRKLQLILWKRCKSIARATENDFRHVIKQVGMSQSAAPATQNDMTTCLETFEKERFCSFPHRHGEATGKKRLETRLVGASKRAFRARLPPIFTLCSFKINVFLRVFWWTSKLATSNFHHISQNACHAKRRNGTCATSKSDPFCRTYHRHGHTGLARTVADGCGRLRTVASGCGRLRTVASGCGRLRTVANGCERLRTGAVVNATSSEHTLNPPDPQSETGTLATQNTS